ncbi:MAG: hypothetical protein ACKOXQ_01420 [Hydrogenophaga sp.]
MHKSNRFVHLVRAALLAHAGLEHAQRFSRCPDRSQQGPQRLFNRSGAVAHRFARPPPRQPLPLR